MVSEEGLLNSKRGPGSQIQMNESSFTKENFGLREGTVPWICLSDIHKSGLNWIIYLSNNVSFVWG